MSTDRNNTVWFAVEHDAGQLVNALPYRGKTPALEVLDDLDGSWVVISVTFGGSLVEELAKHPKIRRLAQTDEPVELPADLVEAITSPTPPPVKARRGKPDAGGDV